MEQLANRAQSRLSGGITDVATSLTLQSGSAFPSSGNFRILIDNELILVGARSGNDLTSLTRAIEGTLAASHSNNAYVTHVLSSGAMSEYRADACDTRAFANRLAAGVKGRVFLPNDGAHLWRDTGAAWEAWGPIYPMVPPVDADFSWVNQGSATKNAVGGAIHIAAPALNGDSLKMLVKAVPAHPYVITAAFRPFLVRQNYTNCGVCLYDSGTTKAVTIGPAFSTNPLIRLLKWNSPTSFSADYTGSWLNNAIAGWDLFRDLVWVKIEDNSTNRLISISMDGVNWIQVHSVARTDFLTVDKVGFYVNANNATYAAGVSLFSWKQA